jgi:hypothetical protein
LEDVHNHITLIILRSFLAYFILQYEDLSGNRSTWRTVSQLNSPEWLWLCKGNSLPSDFPFPPPKKNPGGHKFKHDREVEVAVTR